MIRFSRSPEYRYKRRLLYYKVSRLSRNFWRALYYELYLIKENKATLISKGWLGDEGVPIETYRYVGPQGYNLTTTLFIDGKS